MGAIRIPSQVKPFCALLLAQSMAFDEVEDVLQHHFGAIVRCSERVPFTQTTYYNREMGEGLTRLYVAFDPLIHMVDLAVMKHTSNQLEAEWVSPSGHRLVNLDPGYLDLGKVVLASTKDHAHRLYVGEGIYAEVTLRYKHKQYQPWEWTYPDYRLPSTLAFFEQVRTFYKTQLRDHADVAQKSLDNA